MTHEQKIELLSETLEQFIFANDRDRADWKDQDLFQAESNAQKALKAVGKL